MEHRKNEGQEESSIRRKGVGLEHNRTGTLQNWSTVGLEYSRRTEAQQNWSTIGLEHKRT